MTDTSWMDPCKCGHSFEDHTIGDRHDQCNVLECNCREYRQDDSWTDDLDEQDLLDQEENL